MQSKCGYIAIVGRPNVGKSTLLNGILGKKISITSPKPQTTRTQILGIKTSDTVQYVYIDTPGIHAAEKNAMNRYMNRLANAVITDADVILFIVEAMHWSAENTAVLEKLKKLQADIILVVNKVDTIKNKRKLLPFIEKITEKLSFKDVVPLSALDHDNVDVLEQVIRDLLPAGPHFFPDDQETDKSLRFQITEIIREQIIRQTEQEIPYSALVEIENFQEEEKITKISAIIWVERDGQKPIVIGKSGERLKRIGTRARKDLETLLKQKVFLQLWVKVKEGWTDNEKIINNLGLD